MVSLCVQAQNRAYPLQMNIADHFTNEEAIGYIIDEFNSKVTSNKLLTKRDLFVLFKQSHSSQHLMLNKIPHLSQLTRLGESQTVRHSIKNGQILFLFIKRNRDGHEVNAFMNTSSQFSQETGQSILTSNAEEQKWKQLKDGRTDLI